MKKVVIVACLVFICASCFWYPRGYWVDDACRPKRPNFRILKSPFKKTDKLVFNRIYDKVNWKYCGIGFYPDGRIIQWDAMDENKAKKEISWENAHNIGYWRVNGVSIEYEYFVCSDFGFYNRRKGQIRGDTIIIYQTFYDLRMRKEVREERYILSDRVFH